MTAGPYLNGYLPVSRASDALRNQADTMLSELHGSIDRAKAFREKLAAREAEKIEQNVLERRAAEWTWEAAHTGQQRWHGRGERAATGKSPELGMGYVPNTWLPPRRIPSLEEFARRYLNGG